MTGDPREEDKQSPAETTRAVWAVPNVAGLSNTGNLSGLGGWGVGAIEWVGPQILTVEARLLGEGGVSIAEDKIDRWGWRYVKDNSDIGKRRGPSRSKTEDITKFARDKARDLLKQGWSRGKRPLAKRVQNSMEDQLRDVIEDQHHRSQKADRPLRSVFWIERAITPEWQEFRGKRRRKHIQ